jgi:hypothetical protein
VVAPQVPGRGPVGPPVFDHWADGHGDDRMGVLAPGGGHVRQVRTEPVVAVVAAALGVRHEQVESVPAGPIAEVVEGAVTHVVAVGGLSARGATAVPRVAGPLLDPRRRQILDAGDALGGIRDVFSGWHTHRPREFSRPN